MQRWLTGRTPHPRHRTRVAQALAVDEIDVWPDATPTQVTDNPLKEIAGAWPHANDPDAPDWRELLDAAGDTIELLDFTLHGILTEPGVTGQLVTKAAHGAEVRILIANPNSAYLDIHDQELGHEPAPEDADQRPVVERELDESIKALQPVLARRGIEVRQFVAERFNTILRFDQDLLVTFDLYGFPTSQAPLLHLRRRQDTGLFDQFTAHFQRIWESGSEPLEPDTHHHDLVPELGEPEPNAPPTPGEAQRALDRLRAHRPL